jgi:TetR/AcrR family transcriptional regulator
MVSQRARHGSARQAILRAAAAEFAARGFDGATVDRIAARAGVNKALLYYYFHNKAGLYREILRDLFAAVATAVSNVRAAGGTPEAQLVGFIRALAREAIARPHFPPIWLREMADGGRHVDAAIIGEVQRVLTTLAGTLDDGRRAGRFHAAHPLLTQLSIVGPLLMFLASAPVRARFGDRAPAGLAQVDPESMIAHVERSVLTALTAPWSARSSDRAAPPVPSRPRRSRR